MQKKNKILQLVKQTNPANPLAYVHDIVRDYSRDKLGEYILACQDCSICAGPKSLPKGNTDATVMIIGEAINQEQYETGEEIIHPLEGTEGFTLLKKVLDHYEVNHDEIFYMNTVNCFPCKIVNDKMLPRTPSKKEVNNCKVFLEYAIDIVKPTVIILLGSVALNIFKQDAISKARGEWIDVKGIPAMPTYHPEYFIQIEGKKHPDIIEELKIDFCDDIKEAFLYIQENHPDNNVLLKPLTRD